MSELAKQRIEKEKQERTGKLDLNNLSLTSIPAELTELTWLTSLSLHSNKINDIRFLGKLTSLTSLNLSSNIISDYSFLGKLTSLTSLSLRSNKINDIRFLGKLTSLTSLSLSNNEITDYSFLEKLTSLTSLDLSYNKVSDYTFLEKLTSLTSLYLISNNISNIRFLEKLTSLTSLYLSNNNVSDYTFLEKLTSLTTLDLNYTRVSDYSFLEKLASLTSLDLSNNQISDIRFLEKLTALTSLNLCYNQINDIRFLEKLTALNTLYLRLNQISDYSHLEKLTALTSLDLSANQISDIRYLEKLTALNTLDLSANQISDIRYLEKLTALTSLDLSYNQISDIRYLEKLTALNTLYLNDNQISDICFLEKLTALNTLDLSDNQISDISPLLGLIRKGIPVTKGEYHYDWIRLYNNPLATPPLEIVQQGNEAVLKYFEDLQKSKEAKLPDYINRDIKLIFVGNSEAGKTTLAHYLENDAVSKSHPSTHWMEVREWKKNFGKKSPESNEPGSFMIRSFDFGGQDFYHDTHHLFFTNNAIYLLLWDKKTNFLGEEPEKEQLWHDNTYKKVKLQHFPLNYWLEAICYYSGEKADQETPISREIEQEISKDNEVEKSEAKSRQNRNILVLQNKVDQDSIVFMDEAKLQQDYPAIYDFGGISLWENFRLDFLKQQLSEIFESAKLIGATLPGHYGIVKDSLATYEGKPQITVSEFKDYCNGLLEQKKVNLEFTDESAKACCTYLSDIGMLLYFPKVHALKDIVFINRNWVTKNIFQILLDLSDKVGEFDEDHICSKLGKATFDEDCKALILLMQHFRMIFKHPHEVKKYLAPLYLPNEPHKGVSLFLDTFHQPLYRLQYTGFIHKGVILHFFQEFGKDALYEQLDSKQRLYYYWREGIILKGDTEDDVVMVRFVHGTEAGSAHIDLFAFSKHAQDSAMLKRVLEKLEEINKDWKPVKMVAARNGKGFVPLAKVHEMEANKMWIFEHDSRRFELSDFSGHLQQKYPLKKLFISYSKEDVAYLRQLEAHLSLFKRQQLLSTWHDRKLEPGEAWDGKIREELETADIIVLLVSSDFLATDYIWDIEVDRAMKRHEKGQAVVVPILIRPCLWEDLIGQNTHFSKLAALPEKARPVSVWSNEDEAWTQVAKRLKEVIQR